MPLEYESVTVVVPANVYFDGAVTSRTVRFADGSEKTLGLMQAGEYEFGTEKPERMEVIAGGMAIRMPGETDWTDYGPGEAFDVPGDARFEVRVDELADYVCSYL